MQTKQIIIHNKNNNGLFLKINKMFNVMKM